MKKNIYFFLIPIKLESILRIAGDKDNDDIIVNGDGHYIIPSTSIAGAVKDYISKEYDSDCGRLLGDLDHNSSVMFLEALCRDVSIERRKGICIDEVFGVAENLFTQYYIGQGMKSELKMVFEADDEDRELVLEMMEKVCCALDTGMIRLGAKKTNGAGVFSIDNPKYLCFDMTNCDDREVYINSTIDEIFEKCSQSPNQVNIIKLNDSRKWSHYSLEARIPSGLLVKSGEVDDKKAYFNMTKIVDRNSVFYIPGTTIKGLLRSNSKKIIEFLNIDSETTNKIFGNSANDDNSPSSGTVFVDDCIIQDAVETYYNRIQVDRFTGGTVSGAKAVDSVVSTKNNSTIRIGVSIDGDKLGDRGDADILWNIANAVIYLSLRDLGIGKLQIGSGDSVGYGRLEGTKLIINGKECLFQNRSIDLGESEELIKKYLKALEV